MKKMIKTFLSLAIVLTISSMILCVEVFAATKPGNITLGTCVVTPSYTTIVWNKASYATKYVIKYKKASDNSYKTVSTTKTYYCFNGLSDTTYNFVITAYNGSTAGNAKSFSFKNYHVKSSFKVWYNAQNGATQLRCKDVTDFTLNKKVYKVTGYQAAKVVSGNYSLLKTIKNTTYSVTSISQPHIAQQYAMRCYTTVRQPNGIMTNYFTDYASMKVVPTPNPVTGISAYTSGNTVSVRWSIPKNGADGYRIYVSRKKTGANWTNWKCEDTIKSGSATSYSFTGSASTGYRFKVAAISLNATYSSENHRNENEANLSNVASCSTSTFINATSVSYRSSYSFNNYDGLILVGDSRTEYMSKVSGITNKYSNTIFIGLSGSGYDYLNETAVPKLKTYLNNSNKKYIVVFNHGVNDLEDVDKYISLYAKLITTSSYSRHAFYFMSVNPVFDGCRLDRNGSGTGATNIKIKQFNSKMKSYFGANKYLDCFSNNINIGYDSYDGIHYTDDTNRQVMGFILNSLYSKKL